MVVLLVLGLAVMFVGGGAGALTPIAPVPLLWLFPEIQILTLFRIGWP